MCWSDNNNYIARPLARYPWFVDSLVCREKNMGITKTGIGAHLS